MTTQHTDATDTTGRDAIVRVDHDADTRRDRWGRPQVLTALLTPIVMLASLLFFMAGRETETLASGGLALVLATASALLSGVRFRGREPRHMDS